MLYTPKRGKTGWANAHSDKYTSYNIIMRSDCLYNFFAPKKKSGA